MTVMEGCVALHLSHSPLCLMQEAVASQQPLRFSMRDFITRRLRAYRCGMGA